MSAEHSIYRVIHTVVYGTTDSLREYSLSRKEPRKIEGILDAWNRDVSTLTSSLCSKSTSDPISPVSWSDSRQYNTLWLWKSEVDSWIAHAAIRSIDSRIVGRRIA